MHFNLKELRDNLNPSPRILMLDGDWLVFKAMSAAEEETEWENDVWTLECDHRLAKEILDEDIKSLVESRRIFRGASIIIAFSDSLNWRKELVDESYKANRKGVRKPVGYKQFLQKLKDSDEYITVSEPMLEADDVIGIVASDPHTFSTESVTIISCDKDFRTIPNCDFLWCSNGNIYKQTKETADFWHLYQTMKGDLTDGYSGIRGWGEKAEEFLNEPYYLRRVEHVNQTGKSKGKTVIKWVKETIHNKTTWECILSVASKVDMSEEDVIKQGRLARILRGDEYDIDTQTIKLWLPN